MSAFARLFIWELRRLLRTGTARAALGLLFVAGLLALAAADREIDRQAREITSLDAHYASALAVVADHHSPRAHAGEIAYYTFFPTHHAAPALAKLSLGLRDLVPAAVWVRLLGLEGQLYTSAIGNPAVQALGPFDLAFVVCALAPLALLLLAHDLLSRDRDHGLLPLALTQAASLPRLFTARLLVRAAAVAAVCVALWVIALLWLALPLNLTAFAWLTDALLHLACWTAIAGLIAATCRSLSASLATAGTVWVGAVVVLPALLNLAVATGGVAGGSVNGTPVPNANVTGLAAFSNTPLLVPRVNAYLTTVTLEAMQGSFKALAGQLGMTPNQIAVASSLDSLTTITLGKTGIFKELNFLDTQALATLKSNLDKIAPEELTSIFHLGVSLSNIYGNNLDRRMQDLRQLALGGGGAPAPATNQDRFLGGAPGPRGVRSKKIAPPSNDQWGMFLTGSGEFTRVGSTTNASGYNFTTGGVTAGLDYRVNGNFAVGLSLGYANTTASLANGGSLDVDGGRLGLYATYFEENFHMDASVTGGLNSYRTRRVTPNNTIATASPNGAEINVKIGAGYDWKFGGLTVGPVISYQYTNMQLDGFTEAGAFAPLTVAGRSEESSRTSLGVRAYYDGRIGSKVFRPEVRLAWQHEFGATGYSLTSSFATLGGSPFIVSGTTIGRDSLLASAGFVIMWNDRLSTFVYYDGQFGSQNFDSHNVSAGMRLQF